jgi:hypothetical protein
MPNLTAGQAIALSDHLFALNQSIEEFRFDKTRNLSPEQKKELDDSMDKIAVAGQEVLALSVTLVMNDAQAALLQIQQITEQMSDTFRYLKSIQKAIDVATSVVTLASAIVAKNPDDIASALSELSNRLAGS